MRAAVLWDGGRFTVEGLPDPSPAANEVVVRVDRCGICGTDVHQVVSPNVPIPETGVVMGHEVAGEVVAAGGEAGAHLVGSRVAVEHLLPCRRCLLCQEGRVNLCPDRTYFLALDVPGGYAEYVTVDARMCVVVDQDLSIEMVAMIEPLAVAEHAVARADVAPWWRVAVIGAGPIGTLCVLALRASGVEAILSSDLSEARRDLASAVGAHRVVDPRVADLREEAAALGAPLGFDCVFDCTGRPEAWAQATDVVRPGGTVMMVGSGNLPFELLPYRTIRKELVIKSSLAYNDYDQAQVILASHPSAVAALLGGDCALDDVGSAIQRLATDPRVGKILVAPAMASASAASMAAVAS